MWVEKYRPKSLQDFFCYRKEITIINRWMKEMSLPNENSTNSLFLSGPPGIGKTTLARLILQENNYFVVELNASDIRSQKSVQDILKKSLQSFDVLSLQKKSHQIVGIIMDEVDGMNSGDRGGLTELIIAIKEIKKYMSEWIERMTKGQKKNEKIKIKKKQQLKISPIINISNVSADKKLIDLKKNSVEIALQKPTKVSLEQTCLQVMDQEDMSITRDALDSLIEYSQQDYRKLLMLLEELHRNYQTMEIDKPIMTKFLLTNQRKKIDLTIFEATKILCEKYPDSKELISLYETDRSLISMMLHENMLKYIQLRKSSQSEKMEQILQVSNQLSIGDVIDKYIYNFQCWHLQDLNGFIKCGTPSYYINKYPFRKKKELDSQLQFTSVLSRQAVHLNNVKIAKKIKKKCNIQRRYVSQIGCLLTQRMRFPSSVSYREDEPDPLVYQLANKYEISLSNVEKLIKIQTWDLAPIHITKKNRNFLRNNLIAIDEKKK